MHICIRRLDKHVKYLHLIQQWGLSPHFHGQGVHACQPSKSLLVGVQLREMIIRCKASVDHRPQSDLMARTWVSLNFQMHSNSIVLPVE